MKLETLDHVTAALATMRAERIHQQSLTAELNAELAKIKNRLEPQIQKHKDAELAQAEAVQAYFDAHRAELLPGKLKSTKLEGHAIGYRANGGAISFTKKSGGAKKVLEALKAAGGKLARLFIRTTEAVDKAAMKDEWEAYGEELAALGVRLTEEELFFIELDMEGSPKA
jgi:phage host-nuclease inhibitor protein Gam